MIARFETARRTLYRLITPYVIIAIRIRRRVLRRRNEYAAPPRSCARIDLCTARVRSRQRTNEQVTAPPQCANIECAVDIRI